MSDDLAAFRASMNEMDQGSLREGMTDRARLDESVSRLLLEHHLVLYFTASEERRAAEIARLEDAVQRGVEITGTTDPSAVEWRKAWPAAARAAILALWRTPRT